MRVAGDVGEEDVNPQGEEVGTGARDQREALIAVDVGGHPGVHAGTDHADAQLTVAVHQIKGGLGSPGQGGQIGETGGVIGTENPQKVIAGPLRHIGDGRVGVASRAIDHFVEGPVPAAGVDAHRGAGTGRPPGEPFRVSCGRGEDHLVLQAQRGKGLLHPAEQRLRAAPLPSGGVDEEEMLHGLSSFHVGNGA